jgi:phenylpyruvate tautomerase PptA (4-oxalocrotonate tautomerase family)
MPILEVEIVLAAGEALAPGLAGALAERAGAVFGAAPGRTWVRLRAMEREQYAEDGGGPPAGVHPVFVTVLKARWPERDQLAAEVAQLTAAVAQVCGRPAENVHVAYLPEGAGRVAFGGRLVA